VQGVFLEGLSPLTGQISKERKCKSVQGNLLYVPSLGEKCKECAQVQSI
jgi:hypothetical protein